MRAQTVRRRAAQQPPGAWSVPRCTTIDGFPSVAMSTDGGQTTLPHSETLEDVQLYTFGLAPLETPDRLLSITSRLLIVSSDAGCSWSASGFTFPEQDYRVEPTRGGAWSWSTLSPQLFLLGDSIEQRTAPTPRPLAFRGDRADPSKLAVADDAGNVWWSDDGGTAWSQRPPAPARAPLYVFAFSPASRTHAVAGGLGDGLRVTFDAGATWVASVGLESHNVFRVAFSAVDPNVLWAIALKPSDTGKFRRGIHRSVDGGRTFRLVLLESQTLDFPNGFTMAPSPVDASLLYFVLPGTALYLIDETGSIRFRTPLPYRDVNVIAFSPASPEVLYLGLRLSDMS